MSQAQLDKHKQDWEELGDLDPLWAILSDPNKKYGKWDLDEFFATGETEIGGLMKKASAWELPKERVRALDFGCGAGRLTRALGQRFEECYGIDISESMIAHAKKLNSDVSGCRFEVNDKPHLQRFETDTLDLVYTRLVLQHIPQKDIIEAYIRDFVRILKPGGLLFFQLPSRIPFRKKLQPRRRAYSFLKALGCSESFLYNRLGLFPMFMNAIPSEEIQALIQSSGGRILHVENDDSAGPIIESSSYYVTK